MKTTSNGRQPQNEDDLQWKTNFHGMRPPMEDDLQWMTTSNGRRPPVEDDLKIRKVKYLINPLFGLPQLLNLSLARGPNQK